MWQPDSQAIWPPLPMLHWRQGMTNDLSFLSTLRSEKRTFMENMAVQAEGLRRQFFKKLHSVQLPTRLWAGKKPMYGTYSESFPKTDNNQALNPARA